MTLRITQNEQNCDLTLFLACYNEEKGIIQTLECVLAAVREVGCSYDIVIIDDASTDASVSLVTEFIDKHPDLPITLYINEVNQGLGANFAEGAFRGRGKYYRLVCGDNVESKERLVSIFKHLGKADMILPVPSDNQGRSLRRTIISNAFTALVNAIGGFKIKYYNGLTVHLRYNVMRWHSNAYGFGFQAELVTRLLDMDATYIEVAVPQSDRTEGTSKAFTLRNICSVSHSLLEILLRRVGKLIYPKAGNKPLLRTLRVYSASNRVGGDTISTVAEARGDDQLPLPAAGSETKIVPPALGRCHASGGR